jgi:hypothetical protein
MKNLAQEALLHLTSRSSRCSAPRGSR